MGKIGRQAVAEILPQLKKEYQPEAVIVNVENIAHGKGVTSKTLKEMMVLGIDVFTSGNHVWRKEDVLEAIEASGAALITPANDPRTPGGFGYKSVAIGSKKLFVINLLGRVFMDVQDSDVSFGLRCPFKEMDKILSLKEAKAANVILLDLHAEATSEKVAMGWYLDGRVSAMLGTHTHIPTADWKILPQGTAYLTDVGMVGPIDSVIGVKKEVIIEKFLNDSPIVFKIPEEGEVEVNGVYLETDDQTGQAKKFEKINKKVLI